MNPAVILSEARDLASDADPARFFAPLRMTSRLFIALALCAYAASSPAAAPAPSIPAAKAAHARLLDVAVAGDHVVAVGEQGVILISADGKSWEQRPSPVSTMLTRVRFVDAQVGWALGWDATILQTQDAGKSWALRHHDDKGGALFDVLFLDAQHGFAAGAYGQFLETSDGGATWAPRASVFDELGMHVNALLRLPSGTLVAAGERGLVAFSTDAAATWTLLDTPYSGTWFGALPHGDSGLVVFGMRGNVFIAEDLARCKRMEASAWDPYTRENFADPQAIEARGWHRIEDRNRDSLYGALAFNAEAALLVGFNGVAERLDLTAKTLTRVAMPVSETLVKLAVFRGRLIGVGRRGVQYLGPAP
jgi:photosystem II stability/assembly factor-like uncharacterized protein